MRSLFSCCVSRLLLTYWDFHHFLQFSMNAINTWLRTNTCIKLGIMGVIALFCCDMLLFFCTRVMTTVYLSCTLLNQSQNLKSVIFKHWKCCIMHLLKLRLWGPLWISTWNEGSWGRGCNQPKKRLGKLQIPGSTTPDEPPPALAILPINARGVKRKSSGSARPRTLVEWIHWISPIPKMQCLEWNASLC